MSEIRNDILWRTYLVMFIVTGLGAAIWIRGAQIQTMEGAKWRSMADSLYIDMRPVEAQRGNIYSADGSLLATSLPYYTLHWDLTVVNKDSFNRYVDQIANTLANFVDGEYTPGALREEMVKAYKAKVKYFELAKNVSYPDLEKIQKLPIFSKGRNKGGFIKTEENRRQYPFRLLGKRAIGKYEVKNVKRKNGTSGYDTLAVGVEGYFNHYLAGEEGHMLMERISGNTWVPLSNISSLELKAGKDIVTTIDINIQDACEKALMDACQQYKPKWGCAVVMDVNTGAIKAMSNLGSSSGGYWEDYNYAVAASAEPGSTFKLATMMSLIEDGYVKDLSDTIDINYGKKKFYDVEVTDANQHGLKLTTIKHSFEVSSNVGMAYLVDHFYNRTKKEQSFLNNLAKFGLDRPTGVKIDGEPEPFIKTRNAKDWSGITPLWMSMGYELKVTPLQLLSFFNAVANDGRYMQPYIVSNIQEYGRNYKEYFPTVLERRIASRTTLLKARELLTGVVENGTAEAIKSPHYKIAGKTGTAITNYYQYNRGREPKKYQASFVGFFPADKPIYSCIVVLHEPETGIYGSTVAAPAFREIADRCYSLRPDANESINKTTHDSLKYADKPKLQVGYANDMLLVLRKLKIPFARTREKGDWVSLISENDTLKMSTRTVQEKLVPNVVGMGLRDAIYIMENAGVKVRPVGVGRVKSQSVRPGVSARGINYVTLTLG